MWSLKQSYEKRIMPKKLFYDKRIEIRWKKKRHKHEGWTLVKGLICSAFTKDGLNHTTGPNECVPIIFPNHQHFCSSELLWVIFLFLFCQN